jgi:hypothetical protein
VLVGYVGGDGAGLVCGEADRRVLLGTIKARRWGAHLDLANGRTGALTPFGCDGRASHTLPLQAVRALSGLQVPLFDSANMDRNVDRIATSWLPYGLDCRASGGCIWDRTQDIRIRISPAPSARSCLKYSRFAGNSADEVDAGGGTRTPDTRIMIPLL